MIEWSSYGERISPETLIQGAIDQYQSERREYWQQKGNQESVAIVDGIAEKIVAASKELIEPETVAEDPLGWDDSRRLAEIEGLSEFVQEAIRIELAWDFCTGVDRKAQRWFELTKFVLRTKPRKPVRQFLQRLARSYIAGFDPECVILCRAVVENALNETFERKRIPIPATPEGRSEMKVKLEAARKFGWLSEDARTDAWSIWMRGSKAAHEDPERTKAVFETIQMTMAVVNELYNA